MPEFFGKYVGFLVDIFRVVLLGLVLSLIAMPSFADDGGFEGDGANVYPIKHSEIQMVSETILMRFDEKKVRWLVDVTMNFHNHGRETNVQMGFPFKERYSSDDDHDDAGVKKKEAPAYDFKSYVDGKVVNTRTKKGTLNPKLPLNLFEKVMTFTVHFDAGENKAVRHTYEIGGDFSSNGVQVVRYILRTGALWRHVIEDCQIKAVMPKSGAKRFYVVSPKEQQAILVDGMIELSWHFKNLKPDFDLKFESLPASVEELSTEKLMEYLKQNGEYHDARYIRYFRNRTYAKYGRKFQNPYVRYQFADLLGRNGNTDFRTAHLSSSDKEFLHFLKFIEREEGGAEEPN